MSCIVHKEALLACNLLASKPRKYSWTRTHTFKTELEVNPEDAFTRGSLDYVIAGDVGRKSTFERSHILPSSSASAPRFWWTLPSQPQLSWTENRQEEEEGSPHRARRCWYNNSPKKAFLHLIHTGCSWLKVPKEERDDYHQHHIGDSWIQWQPI